MTINRAVVGTAHCTIPPNLRVRLFCNVVLRVTLQGEKMPTGSST